MVAKLAAAVGGGLRCNAVRRSRSGSAGMLRGRTGQRVGVGAIQGLSTSVIDRHIAFERVGVLIKLNCKGIFQYSLIILMVTVVPYTEFEEIAGRTPGILIPLYSEIRRHIVQTYISPIMGDLTAVDRQGKAIVQFKDLICRSVSRRGNTGDQTQQQNQGQSQGQQPLADIFVFHRKTSFTGSAQSLSALWNFLLRA